MAGVRVEITGRDAAFARLHALGDRLDDARPMYDAIGGYLDLATDMRFERERGPDGNPWPKSLRALSEGGKTLTDTTQLRRSMTHNAWGSGVEHGTNVVYAATHQEGATIKAKTSKGLSWKYRKAGANQAQWARKMQVTIPARPFIGIDDEDETEIMAIAESFIGGSDAR
jgi:phage virion morphogenesis protein